ncbi:MAG: hypothetical protein WD048_16880 [Chitinophagales bacterium]
MALTIKEALEKKSDAFYIGNRLVLPFKCQLIKLIVDSHIYTELVGNLDIKLNQDPQNTSIYIRSIGQLKNFFDTYKTIKIICCEMDDDLCDIDKHIKLLCRIKENHIASIDIPDDDILFIE